MLVVGTKKIYDFIRKHVDSKSWLQSWLAEVRSGEWQSPSDVKEKYPSSSILSGNRMIFDVKGNDYRMEVQISYKNAKVVIKRLGTHAEYNRWKR